MHVNRRERFTFSRSDVTNLLDKVVELLLGVGIFLSHFLVLGLPLVAGLLEGLHFAFVVAGFDVGLAKPKRVSMSYTQPPSDSLQRRHMVGIARGHLLLVELADRPIRLLSLFLKNLDLALQGLRRGRRSRAAGGLILVCLD